MSEIIETISHIRIGNVEHLIDVVTVGGRTLPDVSELLPLVSHQDGQYRMHKRK